jgi:hypothetical protein
MKINIQYPEKVQERKLQNKRRKNSWRGYWKPSPRISLLFSKFACSFTIHDCETQQHILSFFHLFWCSAIVPINYAGAEAGSQLKEGRTWLFFIREANKAIFPKFSIKISLKLKFLVVHPYHRGARAPSPP